MATPVAAPSRALLRSLRASQPRPTCDCLKAVQNKRRNLDPSRRNASTSSPQVSRTEVEDAATKRWIETPPAMKAPYSINPRPADWKPFECNSDPQKLDQVYDSFLGAGGNKILSDETKWQAVTHKSFDYGRRGFNDRMAFLGKRIFDLQLSLALLNAGAASNYLKDYQDPHGRIPFEHPATHNVEAIAGGAKEVFSHHRRLAAIAGDYKIPDVVRWTPKDRSNLELSGSDMVYAQALLAIIGAVALERGGELANRLLKERVLRPLGVYTSTTNTVRGRPSRRALEGTAETPES